MGSRVGIVIGTVVLLGGAIVLIVWSSMGLSQHTGEICITYRGRTECRVASGTSQEEAIRTAADMACAVLASGMSDRITCQNTTPSKVTWGGE